MVTYGRNTVLEALKSDFEIKEIYFQEHINNDEKISQMMKLIRKKDIKTKFTSLKELRKITKTDEHQGVVAIVQFHDWKLREILNRDDVNSFVYISEATYEHNIGAIIRTAECAGLSGVIIPNNINITATVAKISTGALFHIPIIQASIFQVIKELKKNGFNIVGIERNGTNFTEVTLPKNNLFIIGGEDKSLSDQVRSESDVIIEIPQFGKVNSLNMSVATGVILFEYVRQNYSELSNNIVG